MSTKPNFRVIPVTDLTVLLTSHSRHWRKRETTRLKLIAQMGHEKLGDYLAYRQCHPSAGCWQQTSACTSGSSRCASTSPAASGSCTGKTATSDTNTGVVHLNRQRKRPKIAMQDGHVQADERRAGGFDWLVAHVKQFSSEEQWTAHSLTEAFKKTHPMHPARHPMPCLVHRRRLHPQVAQVYST